MSIFCTIGLHSWSGCKCKKCGKTRDENHKWKTDDCSICVNCGIIIESNHNWDGCTCLRCDKQNHKWDNSNCKVCGAKLDNYEEVDRLLKQLKETNNCRECGKLVERLIEIGDPRVIPLLQQMLESNLFSQMRDTEIKIAAFVFGKSWAEELKKKKDYSSLAAILEKYDGSFECDGKRKAAITALEEIGADAADAILGELSKGNFGCEPLAELALKINDPRTLPILQTLLDQNRFSSSYFVDKINKLCYGNTMNRIISILDSGSAINEKREKLCSYLKVIGYRGDLKYCSCGYPIKIIYSDGSSGYILGILESKATDDPYTSIYICPRCQAEVGYVTS